MLSIQIMHSKQIKHSKQTSKPPPFNPDRMFSEDPTRILHKYILSQTARNQNSRKLKEHLEKVKKYGGKLPKEPEHVGKTSTQEWLRVVGGSSGL